MTAADRFRGWVAEERKCLWSDFEAATRTAARAPDPRDPDPESHWSVHMWGVLERIRAADDLLGGKVSWEEVGWGVWPYWLAVYGVDVPAEGWEWLRRHIAVEHEAGRPASSAEWAYGFRPADSLDLRARLDSPEMRDAIGRVLWPTMWPTAPTEDVARRVLAAIAEALVPRGDR